MKRTTQLVAIAGMAGLFSLGAVLTSTVHAAELPCAHEDSVGCHWDAATQGNGQGDSFTANADGSITYDDPAALDKLNPGWTQEELHGPGTDGYVAPALTPEELNPGWTAEELYGPGTDFASPEKLNPGWTAEELYGPGTDYASPEKLNPGWTQGELYGEGADYHQAAPEAATVEYTDSVGADYSGTVSTSSTGAYMVQPGDTLSSIALRYSTTWQELARVNDIANPDLIFAGQALEV